MTTDSAGHTHYVDFESIRKHGGYVYWWDMVDLLKPTETGTLSSKNYIQGDCKKFQFIFLSMSFHKEPMGGGTGEVTNFKRPWEGAWLSPPLAYETILKSVCQYAR